MTKEEINVRLQELEDMMKTSDSKVKENIYGEQKKAETRFKKLSREIA